MSHKQIRKRSGRAYNREGILYAATRLFERSGFHQVGVEDVIKAANVTKTTLYRHFGNKDGLVSEVLGERIDYVEAGLIAAIRVHDTPRARLKAIFDWHTSWFNQPDFAGCLFYRATAEYGGKQNEIVKISVSQKLSLRAAIQAFVEEMGVSSDRSKSLARSILCLLDGAIVAANTLKEKDAADNAWQMVTLVLDSELSKTRTER